MAVYTPPTETLPIFDNSVFPSSDGTALTIATGLDYFLSYPVAQGSEIFPSNVTLQSTLTDSSGDVGTSGQVLSSTGTGTNWISSGGLTYATYTASATLSLAVSSTLLVIFSGSTASQTLTIPYEYPDGQIIQIRSTASVNVTISSGLVLTFLYGLSSSALSFTLIPEDVINLIYSGSNWFQYTPSNTFTKIVGANGCLAGQTNYVSYNTSALPVTVSTTINTDMFVFLTGSTASRTLSIPVVTNTGQRITIKNTASVDVALAFPSSNVMLFGSLTVVAGPITLKSKGVIELYWGSAFWIQTVPSDALNDLTCDTYNGSSVLAATMAIGTNITGQATGVPISIGTSIGALPAIGISIGGASTNIKLNGPTSSSGNISSTSGNITTAGVGAISTTGTGSISTASGSITSTGIITGTSFIGPSLNASANGTNVGISTTQTSGTLSIGTGARTTAGTISIGTGSGATANLINIGGAGSVSTIGGPTTCTGLLTANGLIKTTQLSSDGNLSLLCNNTSTMNIGTSSYSNINIGASSGGGIQSVNIYNSKVSLPDVAWTPSITQLGFTNSASNSSTVSISANTLTDLLSTGTILPLGTLLVTFNVTVTFSPASEASSMAFSFNNSTGTTIVGVPANAIMTLSGALAKSTFTYTIPVTTTATSNNAEILFRGTTPVGTTASIAVGSARISWIKIA